MYDSEYVMQERFCLGLMMFQQECYMENIWSGLRREDARALLEYKPLQWISVLC